MQVPSFRELQRENKGSLLLGDAQNKPKGKNKKNEREGHSNRWEWSRKRRKEGVRMDEKGKGTGKLRRKKKCYSIHQITNIYLVSHKETKHQVLGW